MTLGQIIIEAVIKAKAMDTPIVEENGTVFVWNANAAEQIEGALSELIQPLLKQAVIDPENQHYALQLMKSGITKGETPETTIMVVLSGFAFRLFGISLPSEEIA